MEETLSNIMDSLAVLHEKFDEQKLRAVNSGNNRGPTAARRRSMMEITSEQSAESISQKKALFQGVKGVASAKSRVFRKFNIPGIGQFSNVQPLENEGLDERLIQEETQSSTPRKQKATLNTACSSNSPVPSESVEVNSMTMDAQEKTTRKRIQNFSRNLPGRTRSELKMVAYDYKLLAQNGVDERDFDMVVEVEVEEKQAENASG